MIITKQKRGAKKKPDNEKIIFFYVGAKQSNIDKLGGVDAVKLHIESKLRLKV